MNDFEQRWRVLARRANKADQQPMLDLPLGFVSRVLARAREARVESWEDILTALSPRILLATTVLACIAAGLSFQDWYDLRIERPKLEQDLTSELSWP